jgi:hypothetical protein
VAEEHEEELDSLTDMLHRAFVNKPGTPHPTPSPAFQVAASHQYSPSTSPTYHFRSRHASASEASAHEDDAGWTTESSWATSVGSPSSLSDTDDEVDHISRLPLALHQRLDLDDVDGSARGVSTPVGRQSRTQAASEVIQEASQRMTIPLEPFHHKVGGHSEIYKFSRRAVCKVSIWRYPASISASS